MNKNAQGEAFATLGKILLIVIFTVLILMVYSKYLKEPVTSFINNNLKLNLGSEDNQEQALFAEALEKCLLASQDESCKCEIEHHFTDDNSEIVLVNLGNNIKIQQREPKNEKNEISIISGTLCAVYDVNEVQSNYMVNSITINPYGEKAIIVIKDNFKHITNTFVIDDNLYKFYKTKDNMICLVPFRELRNFLGMDILYPDKDLNSNIDYYNNPGLCKA